MPDVERASKAAPATVGRDPHESQARRVLNVIVAGIGIVVTAPLLVAIAILVRLTSPGPILYRQVRVGVDRRNPRLPIGNHRRAIDYGGAPFMIYKFRTMAASASRSPRQVWATQNDARVTRLGGLMRKYRLDELPQLFNVLKGEMSIVGPRPERPVFVNQFEEKYPRYAERHIMPPGITGWSQVYGKRVVGFDDVPDKLRGDLFYVENWSLFMDVAVCLKTAAEVLFHKAA